MRFFDKTLLPYQRRAFIANLVLLGFLSLLTIVQIVFASFNLIRTFTFVLIPYNLTRFTLNITSYVLLSLFLIFLGFILAYLIQAFRRHTIFYAPFRHWMTFGIFILLFFLLPSVIVINFVTPVMLVIALVVNESFVK